MAKSVAARQQIPAPEARRATATPAQRPLFVQRFAETPAWATADQPSAIVRSALAGLGARLDPKTRAFMEPRFGQDFSQVRVHSDRAAAEAAGVLNARAFTVGDHIFFGAGQSATGGAGQRLMAHELTHVIQQRGGAVSGVPGPGSLRVSDPGDVFEAAAERNAAAVVSAPARATSTPLARAAGSARGSPPAIQRFLAGEKGHEEEVAALEEAGYSKREAEGAYFGNWLRDFSQEMDKDSPTDPDTLDMIRLLAVGEFNRAPTNKDLGRYLPSEHVDNPLGGETAEDPQLSQAEQDKRLGNLNAEQQAWVKKERLDKDKIKTASEESGLPDYIERGKAHAKEKIELAARQGRTPEGLDTLANGLHAVEDYFAHSNFVEVALDQLGPGEKSEKHEGEVHEGLIPANNPALEATRHYAGVDPKHVVGPDGKTVDNLGRPRIVTGTSAKDSGDTVGMWEVIKTEIATHEFLKAAVLSAVRRPWAAFRTIGKQVLGRVPGAVAGVALGVPSLILGGVIGGAAGFIGGAAKGAAEGWRKGRGLSKVWTAIKGLGAGAAKGLVSGGETGGGLGWKLGSGAGRKGVGAIGGLLARVPALREVVGAASAVAGALLGAVVEFAPMISIPLKKLARHEIKAKTKATIGENPGRLPTHSQISKDDPDHPLHDAAARLKYVADLEIGRAMIEVWGPQKAPVKQAQDLVDLYVAHPQAGDWWKPVLLDVVRAKPPHGKSGPSLRIRGFWEMKEH
jgi:hypothetical protein